MKKPDFKKIFNFIAETGSLMFMNRSHKRSLINTFDSVASHAHHVAMIAYCLARMEGLTHEESLKAMAMGVLHDNAESRTGDLDFPAKHYSTRDEVKALEHQLQNLPFASDLKKIAEEYEERETLASKCAKDADALEQLYQEWVLMHTGNKMAERWFTSDFKHRVPYLRTKSAKTLSLQMKKSKPHDWWFEELVEKNINRKLLNGER